MLVSLAASVVFVGPAQAAAGDLDPSFGSYGKVVTPIGSYAIANGVVVQPDGKIVLGGYSFQGRDGDFTLARYNPDGSLDTGFGSGGVVTTLIGLGGDAWALALQPDGKILLAGQASNGNSFGFALARYNSDGSLDTGFGSGGTVITPIGPYDAQARAIGIQPDGKIVIAGFYQVSTISGDDHFAVVRYKPDGSLDPSFGAGGVVTTRIGSEYDRAFALALRPDGRILLAGGSLDLGGGGYLTLAGYRPDGTLDPGFGGGGVVRTSLGRFDEAFAIALQPNGKILVGGLSLGLSERFALARLNPDGSLDAGFGSGGAVEAPIGSQADARALALQPDGKIVLGGETRIGRHWATALARYNADGSLDTGFGSGGTVTTAIGSGDDRGTALALQADGKIVLGGISSNISSTSDARFAVVRYLGTTPTTIEAQPEIVSYGTATVLSGTLAAQPAGKPVLLYAQSCGEDSETAAATATTGSAGAWEAALTPVVRTVYRAVVGGEGTSRKVTVQVRPQVTLAKVAPHLFRARIRAARSLVDEIAVFQLYRAARRRWVTVRRIVLREIGAREGTTASGTTFHSKIGPGRRVRLVLPQSQVGSCYLGAVSNGIHS